MEDFLGMGQREVGWETMVCLGNMEGFKWEEAMEDVRGTSH